MSLELCAAVCLALLLASFNLHAQTVVLDFDPPAFQKNQVLGWVGDIGFFGNATVFQPATVASQTPPYALHTPNWCESPTCANTANVLSILFKKKASEVSMRVGSELMTPPTNFFCFPEGTVCGVYARLVGYDGNNVIVDTRDVELFNAGSSGGIGAPITRELKVTDPFGRITGVTLFVGKGTFSHDFDNNPGRAQIDNLRVQFIEGPPSPPPPPPPPPTATILQPSTPLSYPYRFSVEGTWSAPAGLYALCVRVNEPIPVSNQYCTNNATLSGSTFAVELYRESLQPSGNVINVGVIDLLGRKVIVSRALSPQAPPPPLVSIWSPVAGIWSVSSSAIPTLSGSTWVSGGAAGFCVRISHPSSPSQPPPAVSDCNDTGSVGASGNFTGIVLDASKLQPGPNDVTVHVFDKWGQEAHATVRGTVPANLRVSGVEINQGSQTFAMNPTTGPYSGTELSKGLRTIVRVFASASSGGPFPGVNATLEGFVPDYQHGGEQSAGWTLLPDNGKQTIAMGPWMAPLATRAKPDSAFIFTLPTAWTLQSGLRLRATVNNPSFTGNIPECAGCEQDNHVDVTQINFKGPLPTATISPVAIRWHDEADAFKDPPAVEGVFAEFRALVPLTDGQLVVRPYVGRIDMGNTLFSTSTPPHLIDRLGNCGDLCSGQVFGAVAAFEESNQPGLTIGITTAQLRGLTSPVPYFRWPTILAIENIAMASTAYGAEPLKLQVAHEVMHQCGYLHASGDCGAQSQLSQPWPPDFKGRLQGIGIDRRTGSGQIPGIYAIIADGPAPTEAYDIMSYCALGHQSWLSPRYWDRFGKDFTFSTVCLQGNCQIYGVPSNANQGYRVMAQQDSSGDWKILSVTRSLMPPAQNPGAAGSSKLIGRDASGRIVTTVSTEPVSIADRPGARLVTADLPAESLASISLVVDGSQVASRTASKSFPKTTLLYPSAGALPSEKAEVSLKWTVEDADSQSLTMRVGYSDDDGKTYRMIGATSSQVGMDLPLRLFSATKTARVRLTVNDGFNESQFISKAFISPGAPPAISLINPDKDITVMSTATVNLTGAAFDDRGSVIKPEQMQWTVDGKVIGTGGDVLLPRLKPGRHFVELSARDRFDRPGKAGRTILIVDGHIEPVASNESKGRLIWLLVLAFALIFVCLWLWLRRNS